MECLQMCGEAGSFKNGSRNESLRHEREIRFLVSHPLKALSLGTDIRRYQLRDRYWVPMASDPELWGARKASMRIRHFLREKAVYPDISALERYLSKEKRGRNTNPSLLKERNPGVPDYIIVPEHVVFTTPEPSECYDECYLLFSSEQPAIPHQNGGGAARDSEEKTAQERKDYLIKSSLKRTLFSGSEEEIVDFLYLINFEPLIEVTRYMGFFFRWMSYKVALEYIHGAGWMIDVDVSGERDVMKILEAFGEDTSSIIRQPLVYYLLEKRKMKNERSRENTELESPEQRGRGTPDAYPWPS